MVQSTLTKITLVFILLSQVTLANADPTSTVDTNCCHRMAPQLKVGDKIYCLGKNRALRLASDSARCPELRSCGSDLQPPEKSPTAPIALDNNGLPPKEHEFFRAQVACNQLVHQLLKRGDVVQIGWQIKLADRPEPISSLLVSAATLTKIEARPCNAASNNLALVPLELVAKSNDVKKLLLGHKTGRLLVMSVNGRTLLREQWIELE